jgi:hypothetical protein
MKTSQSTTTSAIAILAITALLLAGCANVKRPGPGQFDPIATSGAQNNQDGSSTSSDQDGSSTSSDSGNRESNPIGEDFVLEITANPHSDYPGMQFFTKYVDVFGLGIYAEAGFSDGQVLHAAAILAELLDNDENGVIDDEAVLAELVDQRAIIPMFTYQGSSSMEHFEDHYYDGKLPFYVGAKLYEREVDPTQPGHWGSDASIEEIMHTINQIGQAVIYPDAFSLEPGTSLLTEAMDEARGGRFLSVPDRYPPESWYHYEDQSCTYRCMAIEYIYWAQVSNMEILNDRDTCLGIANEWEPCSQELLKEMDPLIYALITNPEYKLPQNAPNGIYKPTVE